MIRIGKFETSTAQEEAMTRAFELHRHAKDPSGKRNAQSLLEEVWKQWAGSDLWTVAQLRIVCFCQCHFLIRKISFCKKFMQDVIHGQAGGGTALRPVLT